MDTAKLAIDALKPSSLFEAPSVDEVLEIKYLLFMKFDLPIEVIDVVIDYAEYWPRTTVSTTHRTVSRGSHGNAQDILVIRTLPLGYGIGDPDNGPPVLQLETYTTMNNLAHVIDTSDALNAMTSDVLSQWTKQSRPRGEYPCRKVVFTMESKDQGWGGDRPEFKGTFRGSWTWFDVGLEQFKAVNKELCTPEVQIPNGFREQFHLKRGNGKDIPSICCDLRPISPAVKEGGPEGYIYNHPSGPGVQKLQANRTATKEMGKYIITWAYDDLIDAFAAEGPAGDKLEQEGRGRNTETGDFVRSLQVGDIITVWARARFPGWSNELKGIKIDVYWAV